MATAGGALTDGVSAVHVPGSLTRDGMYRRRLLRAAVYSSPLLYCLMDGLGWSDQGLAQERWGILCQAWDILWLCV